MTLISKETTCFHCGMPGFGDDRELKGHPGLEILVETCKHCLSTKTTAIGKEFPSPIAGTVQYRPKEGAR